MVIFGLGVGIILIILLWSLVTIFLLLGNTQSIILKTCLIIAAAISSGILLILPQQTHSVVALPFYSHVKVVDDFFITRLITLLILFLSTIGGLGIVILDCSEPMLALPLTKANY